MSNTRPIRTKICKTCGKSFQKRFNISTNVWNKTTKYCSTKCLAIARTEMIGGEKHYNWKGGFDPKKYLAAHPEIYEARKARNKQMEQEKRLMVLRFYSKSEVPFCDCCKENHIEFLAIDHIDGGGREHRKKIGNGHMAAWLIRNGFPKGFKVLCHNCNMAKGFYKQCPHQKARDGVL